MDPFPAYLPLLYADINCFPAAFQRVIRNQADWQDWWTTAVGCLPRVEIGDPPSPRDDPGGAGGGTGAGGSDSSVVYPDSGSIDPVEPYDPYGPNAPDVDFENYVVVVIGLEPEATWGRGLWITEVVGGAGGSTIKFEVSKPGEDCFVLLDPVDPGGLLPNSPTVAVLVPQPVGEPVTFERSDVTWSCLPDPNLPLTLYYTDTECELGPAESLITAEAGWQTWLDTAIACDLARWGDPGDPTIPGDGGEGDPGGAPGAEPVPIDPIRPPSDWLGLGVDFSTHAVLILRAGSQDRWGGGIWLNNFEATASGTKIDYSVVEPSSECPKVEGGQSVRPTAAIRLPLPLGTPISYDRHVEIIDCNWEPVPLPPPLPSGARR